MSSTYGDAWIDLLYDLDTVVQITNPTKSEMRVHNIKPERYLVLPGTDKLFPGGVFLEHDIPVYEPKTLIKPGKPQDAFPVYERKNLEKCKVGEIYPVTLVQRIINVDNELSGMQIPRVDSSNQLTFQPGELEKRLSAEKRNFLALLERAGLKPDKDKLYFRLVGSNPRF